MTIREPFEPPSVKEWALIIHADSAGDRVDVYWADINAGRIGLRLASEVKAWRRRDDLLTIGRRLRIAIPSGGMVEPVLSSEPDSPELVVPLSSGWNALDHPDPVEESDALIALGRNPQSIASATKELEPPEIASGGVASARPAPASSPPEGPREPVAPSTGPARIESRHDYLAGRVRALIEHSETAKMALARAWPEGVSGLRNDGQTWEELDLILDAVLKVEKDHSVPFYPEWDDPDIEESKSAHPSNVWARPKVTQSTPDDRENIQGAIMAHPRSGLMRRWIGYAINGGIDHNIDTAALAHALFEFGNMSQTEWPDDDLTTMLDGSLRALGYSGGVEELGRFNPEHAPLLMSAAFAIAAGNAYLLFGEDEKPIVRTNVVRK